MIIAIGVREEITAQRWKVSETLFRSHSIEILLQRTEFRFSVQRRFIVDVIEEFGEICVLRFPFGVLTVSKVVAQRNENRSRLVQRGFFAPLIEYEFGSRKRMKLVSE